MATEKAELREKTGGYTLDDLLARAKESIERRRASSTGRRWLAAHPEVEETRSLRCRLLLTEARLSGETLPEAERRRLAAAVRKAAHALDGVELSLQKERLRFLVHGLISVAAVAGESSDILVAAGRRSSLAHLARWALAGLLENVDVSDDTLARAVEAWSRRGSEKWRHVLKLAIAVRAVSKGTKLSSLAEQVSPIVRSILSEAIKV
jgi:hypothetical protein